MLSQKRFYVPIRVEALVRSTGFYGWRQQITSLSTMSNAYAKHSLSTLLERFSLGQVPVILTTTPFGGAKQSRRRLAFLTVIQLLAVQLFIVPIQSRAQLTPPDKEREPLGSLTSVGEVFVNDAPAPAEITIFSGDRVRAGESGSAVFNMSGKGSLKILPRSEVVFSGKYEYTAEFEAGAVLMTSIRGPEGFTLRIGNEVVVPSFKERTASASIEKVPNGSFLVKCSDGAMGILALQGSSGQFIEVGQSVSVSPNGTFYAAVQPGAAPAKSTSSARTHKPGHSFPNWAYVGLGGAGAAGAALALSHGGGKQSISPSSP